MKKNFKTWLCSVLVLGTTLAIGLFAAGCSKDDFKNNIDQAFCEHNYGAVATKTVREATCTVEGEELWTCIECGKEKTVVLDKLEHDFSASKGGWTKTKQAATCREEGIQESRCGVCKTIVTESIAKLPHTEVSVEQKLPTCTVAGHTEYTYCSACNDFITPKVTIPALGHNVEVVEGYEATCDSKGLTDGKVCEDCGEVLTEQKDIPALGHKIEYLAPVEATCEMTGLTAGYACVRCDKVYTAQNVVEKLPHVDKDGDDYCDICGADSYLPANYKEVSITSETPVVGKVLRFYKPTSVSNWYNTVQLTGDFVGVTEDGEEFAFTGFYIGLSYESSIVSLGVGGEPPANACDITNANTTLEIYETEEYVDVVFKDGAVINFSGYVNGLYSGVGTGTSTITIDETVTVSSGIMLVSSND